MELEDLSDQGTQNRIPVGFNDPARIRIMGTSIRMIALHHRTTIVGAGDSIAARLDALR